MPKKWFKTFCIKLLGDETALIIKNKLNLSEKQIKDLETTVVSIKVSAIKQEII